MGLIARVREIADALDDLGLSENLQRPLDLAAELRALADAELVDEVETLRRERAYALRDAELARERADRNHQQIRGAVEALRELVAAQDNAYAASASGSGRASEAVGRLAKAMDAARAITGGQHG